jgi:hypothetical protein
VVAPVGTTVSLVVEGEAGGRWSVVRSEAGTWTLCAGVPAAAADATVQMDQDTAWRLFTKGIGEREAVERATIRGDDRLGRRVLGAVAILA